jgi:DNA-binding transcriptional MerR regulator
LDKAPDAFRTISEVAEDLSVPQHVLRFWESRFTQIKPMKRAGGRRYYRPDDVDLLRGIHHLLYGEGYTIRGVQRILRDQGIKFVQTVWQAGADQPARMADDELPEENFHAGAEDDGYAPAERPADRAPAAQAAPAPGMARDDLRRLQVTLFELGECRRLLDEAMKPV